MHTKFTSESTVELVKKRWHKFFVTVNSFSVTFAFAQTKFKIIVAYRLELNVIIANFQFKMLKQIMFLVNQNMNIFGIISM